MLRHVTECVLQLPPVTGNQQWGYVLESRRRVGYIALPLPLTSLVPSLGALVSVTLVRGTFDYIGCAYSGGRIVWCTYCLGKPRRDSAIALWGNGFYPWSRNACTISREGPLHEPGSALRPLPPDPSPCF